MGMERDPEPVLPFFVQGDTFTLVQVTDLHLAFRYVLKRRMLRQLRGLLREASPDLVINTGDLFCRRQIFPARPLLRFYQHYVGSAYPWAFAWGNHDLELREEGYRIVERALGKIPNLLYGKSHDYFYRRHCGDLIPQIAHPDDFMGGNYVVELRRPGQEQGRPLWQLFVFNTRNDRHLPAEVLEWAGERTAAYRHEVPALCFMHRPLRHMRDAASRGGIQGISYESVACGPEDGSVGEGIKRMKTVQACFFGHDHLNNYWMDAEGIRYHASRKTLSLAYGADSARRAILRHRPDRPVIPWGITKLRLDLNSSRFRVCTILEDGSVFMPYELPSAEAQLN